MSLKTEAVKLLTAEDDYSRAKGALEKAKHERDKARARCRPLLATDTTTLAGDISITVTACVSNRSFKLAEYLRNHRLTKAMEPFVGEGSAYDRWTVKRISSPS